LPNWVRSSENLWPEPPPNPAAELVQNTRFPTDTVGVGSFIGPGWELMQKAFRALKDRERQDQTNNYARMTEQQEERINREEAERIAAMRGGR
jgi:hypothetical protein